VLQELSGVRGVLEGGTAAKVGRQEHDLEATVPSTGFFRARFLGMIGPNERGAGAFGVSAPFP